MSKLWNISDIWNSTLQQKDRVSYKRDYLYSSELGKPLLDIFYNLTGEPVTNPFDDRTLRVFSAGYEFQHLMEKVHEKIGILIETEPKFVIEGDGLISIHGRGDIIAGGISDWNEARARVNEYGFSEGVQNRCLALIKEFEEKYPNGLEKQAIEVKSVNSNAFWNKKDYIAQGYPHHRLQLYAEMKGLGISYGKLIYISKDDLTLQEVNIQLPNEPLEEEILNFRKVVTEMMASGKAPEREPDLAWNEDKNKWEPNWRIGRSNYLTKITGEEKEKWEERTGKLVGRYNRVVGRVVEKESLTEDNLNAIGEMLECEDCLKCAEHLYKHLDKEHSEKNFYKTIKAMVGGKNA